MENETIKRTILKDFKKVNKNGQYMLCERYGISNGIKIRAMIYIQTHKRHTNEWHICMNNFNRHDLYTNHIMNNCLNNMNKIKQVFKERKINIDFRNGWKII